MARVFEGPIAAETGVSCALQWSTCKAVGSEAHAATWQRAVVVVGWHLDDELALPLGAAQVVELGLHEHEVVLGARLVQLPSHAGAWSLPSPDGEAAGGAAAAGEADAGGSDVVLVIATKKRLLAFRLRDRA